MTSSLGSPNGRDRFIAGVKEVVGPNGWLDGEDAAPHLIDWREDFSGEALLVVRPASTEEVAAVVRLCAAVGVVVLAQGGNTGLSGGSVPSVDRPTIVLSLTRMRAIEEVNADRFTIQAQAGVSVQELKEAAAAVGRSFAPDWGARGSATIGGGIATNAGGINVLRHGTMRDQVLGLEVVLADGRIWDGLRSLPKDNSGYDLKQLFIASEGTLGVVTRAVVKLHPADVEQSTAFVALADVERLNELFSLARAGAPQSLSAFELIPETGVALVVEKYGAARPIATISEWYVLVRVSGAEGAAELLLDLLEEATTRGLIDDAVLAETASQEANLWHIRDELPPQQLFGGYMVKYDLAVPVDRIAEFHRAVRELVESEVPGARPYVFGHVGDGNLHLTVWPADSSPGLLEQRKSELVAAIDQLTWRFGGTISAEHGIGQELRERIVGQKPEVELELMRAIKDVFDPQNLLNPGKIFPD